MTSSARTRMDCGIVRPSAFAVLETSRLRLSDPRRKSQAESENDLQPDQPHGHLGEDGWRESSREGPGLSRPLAGAPSPPLA